MAAFSYQHYPLHLDSVFFPNSPFKNLSGFMEEPNINISQFYPPPPPLDLVGVSDNEPSSVTKKQSTDSSSVVDKLESGEQVTQKLNPSMPNKRKKNSNASSSTSPLKEDKEGRSKKQKKSSNEMKEEEKKPKTKKKVTEEEPPTGYIHVRARRGQATDSHSLAERVRREKISERMKILQRLVPGCDKVTGKALMLDEIINYVQSLQNQVEFLSMKLASVNPLFYDFGMDLDALTLGPDQGLSNYVPSVSTMQQQSTPALPTVFADATTAATDSTSAAVMGTFPGANRYHPVIDASASLLLQGHRPSGFIQESGSLMWDVDEQRQKFLNPSGLISNNLCSFN